MSSQPTGRSDGPQHDYVAEGAAGGRIGASGLSIGRPDLWCSSARLQVPQVQAPAHRVRSRLAQPPGRSHRRRGLRSGLTLAGYLTGPLTRSLIRHGVAVRSRGAGAGVAVGAGQQVRSQIAAVRAQHRPSAWPPRAVG
jgi:hypothetical protein